MYYCKLEVYVLLPGLLFLAMEPYKPVICKDLIPSFTKKDLWVVRSKALSYLVQH